LRRHCFQNPLQLMDWEADGKLEQGSRGRGPAAVNMLRGFAARLSPRKAAPGAASDRPVI